MTAANSIGRGFKELIKEFPYTKITVSDICERAGVSRKTFYANFDDKQDVIERLFYDEILKPLEDLQKLLPVFDLKSAPMLLCERMYQSIFDDRCYYESLIKNSGSPAFVEIVTKQTQKINEKIVARFDLPLVEKEYMAYFFGAAQAMLLVKWIRDHMTVPPHQMATFFTKWSIHSWEAAFPDKRHF